MQMYFLDAILAVLILFAIWGGYRQGFLRATTSLLTLLASVVFAFAFHRLVADALADRWPTLDPWLPMIAFAMLFLLAAAISGAIAWAVVGRIPAQVHQNGFNRALGMVPGAVNGLVAAIAAVLVVLTVPYFATTAQDARQGIVSAHLARPAGWLSATLTPVFKPAETSVAQRADEALRSVPLQPSATSTPIAPAHVSQ